MGVVFGMTVSSPQVLALSRKDITNRPVRRRNPTGPDGTVFGPERKYGSIY
jgi:hypothetical protein